MPILKDEEFGTIIVRKSLRAKQVSIRVAPNGTLRASMPTYAPLFLLRRLLKTSREQLRTMLLNSHPQVSYSDGQRIGKSHTIIIRPGTSFTVRRSGQQIIVKTPSQEATKQPANSQRLRDTVVAALRSEAKQYLPKRLLFLANQHGYSYSSVRFSHASSRWGSCSSKGTISLNIALMKLPLELIDYVIIHELAHTKHMNHSKQFWQTVSIADKNYLTHRKRLKAETPSI